MRLSVIVPLLAMSLFAQDPVAQPPVAQPPESTQPASPPPPPTLEYSGKPMVVPFQCTEEDIRSGGLACTDEDPCPVYLELASAGSTGIRLFVAGNIHTATATLFSIILGSDDNGHTWREVHERLRFSTLEGLQFSDTDNGWASGIELSPLPQDPFLLKATDGGKTWRQVALFEDTRYGTILQYQFQDKSTGTLIFDRGSGSGSSRYERYESRDGGDSWTLKETSAKPFPARRPADPSQPEWRVRADANSRSFHLEHREGGRWSPVAQFAVNLGMCRPQP